MMKLIVLGIVIMLCGVVILMVVDDFESRGG
jgi:hypothetical protein